MTQFIWDDSWLYSSWTSSSRSVKFGLPSLTLSEQLTCFSSHFFQLVGEREPDRFADGISAAKLFEYMLVVRGCLGWYLKLPVGIWVEHGNGLAYGIFFFVESWQSKRTTNKKSSDSGTFSFAHFENLQDEMQILSVMLSRMCSTTSCLEISTISRRPPKEHGCRIRVSRSHQWC